MTRKDYERIAAAIREAGARAIDESAPHEKGGAKRSMGYIIGTLSSVLRDDNPQFDAARFFDACGV